MRNSRHRNRNNFHDRKLVVNRNSPLFDNEDYHRTCASKNAYETEYQANFTITEMKSRYGVNLGTYKCPYCGQYHLTERN
jgi:hypothetical protein